MKKQGFIVSVEDEYENEVNLLKKAAAQQENFALTVNPTLDCNFRCWYCYEDCLKGSVMNDEVLSATNATVNSILSRPEIKSLSISFFGGEPLLYYENIIKPIIRNADETSRREGKDYCILFTTNGFLLKRDIVDDLKDFPVTDFQIPIDGGKDSHDKVKHMRGSNESAFNTTIENIKYALDCGFNVTVRCNYTAKTIKEFTVLTDLFLDYKDRKNLMFSFHKVWQEKPSEELYREYNKVRDTFKSKGYRTSSNISSRGLCYADKKNSAVINYDGNVFKCTARKFKLECRLGTISRHGEIEWNETEKIFSDCKYKSDECRNCRLFPLCLQGCAQCVFESKDKNSCPLNYSEEDKTVRIQSRIKELMDIIAHDK